MKKSVSIAVASLFFFSGMTSLVYQAVWIRTLSLGVGSTSTSMGLVLSIFFFGLAAGSYLTGRFVHRIKKPILFYGLIEAFIGIYALGLIYVLIHFHSLLAILPLSGSLSWFGTLCKFLLVFALLILPTLCMGASLPLLIHFFIKDERSMGRYVSILYGINTLGAVAGAFLAGFSFIPAFGILWTNHAMAAANILILSAAVFLQGRFGDKAADVGATEKFKFAALSGVQKLVLMSCAITGFSSIAAEVMWNKYLGIFLGSNIFGLSLILSLFLLGIAIGSLVLSLFIDKVSDLLKLYVGALFMACVMMIGASYVLNLAPILTHVISFYIGGAVSLLTIKSVLVGLILFFPTCFFGALLPLGIRLLTFDAKSAASVTGTVYSVNTVGAILGSYLAGIVLIPWIGSGKTLQLALLLLLIAGALIAWAGIRKVWVRAVYLALYGLLIAGSFQMQAVDFKNIVKSAYFQTVPENLTLSQALKYFSKEAERFLLIVEGRTGIISLSQDPAEATNWQDYIRLKTNGLNESLYDLKRLEHLPKYEALLGLLPYALVRDPQNAFVVGFGGGYTVDFLSTTDLKSVYVAELEQGIIDAAQFVYKGNNPVLMRPQVNLKIEDARFVLSAKLSGPYDIIVSQPSHSWLSGVANLFTHEYFEIVKSNLTERGVFSQWLNLYNMDSEVLKSVLHTFFTTFPYGAIFTDLGDEEMIMIGSLQPIQFNQGKLKAIFENDRFQRQLDEFESHFEFMSTFSMGRDEVVEITKGATLNTDTNAFAEVRQSRLFYSSVLDHPGEFLVSHYQAAFESIVPEDVANSVDFQINMLEALKKFPGEARGYQKFFVALDKFTKRHQDDPSHFLKLAEFNYYLERLATSDSYLQRLMALKPSQEALDLLMRVQLAARNYQGAKQSFQKYAPYRGEATNCYALTALSHAGPAAEAQRPLNTILNSMEHYQATCGSYLNQALGTYYFFNGNLEVATPYLQRYYDQYPSDLKNMALLISAYLTGGPPSWGAYYGALYSEALEKERQRLESLAQFFESSGFGEDAKLIRTRLADIQR